MFIYKIEFCVCQNKIYVSGPNGIIKKGFVFILIKTETL